MPPRRPAIIFIFITLLLDVVGFSLLIPVGPKLVESLLHNGQGGTPAEAAPYVGWLASTYYLFTFLFAPFLGVLSDRFGRRPVILISLFGTGVDFIAQALAPTLTIFFITKVINGISGANMPVCTAYVADITAPEKRAGALGMLFAAFGVGFVVGPLMGGWLGHYSLRLPFYVAAGITLLNWLYGYFVLPESLPRELRSPIRWARTNPIGSLAALKRYPVVLWLAVSLFLLNMAQFGLHATWVLSMTYRFNWTLVEVGASLGIVGLMAMIVQGGLVRKVVPWLGERRSLVIGLAIGTVAYIAYGAAPWTWAVFATIVLASPGGIAGPAAQAIITKAVRPDEQGAIQGALASSSAALAGIIGPIVGSQAFAYFVSDQAPVKLPGAPFFVSAALAFAGTIIAAWATRGVGHPEPRVVARSPRRPA